LSSPKHKLKISKVSPNDYKVKTKEDHDIKIKFKDNHFSLALNKWGNEVLFELELDSVKADKFTETGDTLELVDDKGVKMRTYPINERKTKEFYGDFDNFIQVEEGGIRFEIEFPSKPNKNIISIPIKTHNLHFTYQPFLTMEEIDGGHIRPLNVEGSYAVYHTSKKNNKWKTGKAFHIYRPIVEDALGDKAWCKLEVNKSQSELTITIPKQFLDTATYPIILDPDLGYSTIGGSTYNLATEGDSHRVGSAWTAPVGDLAVGYLMAHSSLFGGAEHLPSGRVKALINEKDSEGADSHGQTAIADEAKWFGETKWIEFKFGSPITLSAGTDYILNLVGNGADCVLKEDIILISFDLNGAVASYKEGAGVVSFSNPNDPWDIAEEITRDYSIYVTSPTGGLSGWLRCPYCGEIEDVWRLDKTGVSEARYGKRIRRSDPKRFKCNFCKNTFTTDGATRREIMGYNSSGRDKVAI